MVIVAIEFEKQIYIEVYCTVQVARFFYFQTFYHNFSVSLLSLRFLPNPFPFSFSLSLLCAYFPLPPLLSVYHLHLLFSALIHLLLLCSSLISFLPPPAVLSLRCKSAIYRIALVPCLWSPTCLVSQGIRPVKSWGIFKKIAMRGLTRNSHLGIPLSVNDIYQSWNRYYRGYWTDSAYSQKKRILIYIISIQIWPIKKLRRSVLKCTCIENNKLPNLHDTWGNR